MGKTIIIKDVDFSENAIEQVIKRVTTLYYDSDGAGNIQPYEGTPHPIPKEKGLYFNVSGFPVNSRYTKCLTTTLIPIDNFQAFSVHSIFKIVGPVVAIGFANSNNQMIGFYSNNDDALSNPLCLGVVPSSGWCDINGEIPNGAAFIAAGCYGLLDANEYQQFFLELY